MTVTVQEIGAIMQEKNWIAETNRFGMWTIGTQDENGVIKVLGMGHDIISAFEMARRSQP